MVEMPDRNLTSVMFGGGNLDVLYVTSIGRPMKGIPQKEPHAGSVFAVPASASRAYRSRASRAERAALLPKGEPG